MNITTNDTTIAQTILQQLKADGPLGSLACVGARSFTALDKALQFRITISRQVRNWIKVTLDEGSDTYIVELIKQFRAPSHRVETMQRLEGIYCDQLCETVYRLGTPN